MSDSNQEVPSNSSENSETINNSVLVKITPSQDTESDKTESTNISPDVNYSNEVKSTRNGSLPEGLLYQSTLNVILPNFIEHEKRASSPLPEVLKHKQHRTVHSSPIKSSRSRSQDSQPFATVKRDVEETSKVG